MLSEFGSVSVRVTSTATLAGTSSRSVLCSPVIYICHGGIMGVVIHVSAIPRRSITSRHVGVSDILNPDIHGDITSPRQAAPTRISPALRTCQRVPVWFCVISFTRASAVMPIRTKQSELRVYVTHPGAINLLAA